MNLRTFYSLMVVGILTIGLSNPSFAERKNAQVKMAKECGDLLNSSGEKLSAKLQAGMAGSPKNALIDVELLIHIRKDHVSAFQEYVFDRKRHLWDAKDEFVSMVIDKPQILMSEESIKNAHADAFRISTIDSIRNSLMSVSSLWTSAATMHRKYVGLKATAVAPVQIGQFAGKPYHELLTGVTKKALSRSKYYSSPYYRFQLNDQPTIAFELLKSWGVSADQVHEVLKKEIKFRNPIPSNFVTDVFPGHWDTILNSESYKTTGSKVYKNTGIGFPTGYLRAVQHRYASFANELVLIHADLSKAQILALMNHREVVSIQTRDEPTLIRKEVRKAARKEADSPDGFFKITVLLSNKTPGSLDELFSDLLSRGIRPLSHVKLRPKPGNKGIPNKNVYVIFVAAKRSYVEELFDERENVVHIGPYGWEVPGEPSASDLYYRFFWAYQFGVI